MPGLGAQVPISLVRHCDMHESTMVHDDFRPNIVTSTAAQYSMALRLPPIAAAQQEGLQLIRQLVDGIQQAELSMHNR